jgi:hypothetical protein
MRFAAFIYVKSFSVIAFSLSAALSTLPAAAQATPLPRGVYVIPAGGYGVDECVARSQDCGRVVASAWCEAHGHGRATAFGSAADVTFATVVAAKAPPRNALVIACAD